MQNQVSNTVARIHFEDANAAKKLAKFPHVVVVNLTRDWDDNTVVSWLKEQVSTQVWVLSPTKDQLGGEDLVASALQQAQKLSKKAAVCVMYNAGVNIAPATTVTGGCSKSQKPSYVYRNLAPARR